MPNANPLPRIAPPASSTAVVAGRSLEAHSLEPRGTGRLSQADFESIDFESMLIEQTGATSSAQAGAAFQESTVEESTNTAAEALLHWKSPGPQTAAASKQVASEVSREVPSGIPGQSDPGVFSLAKLSTLSLLSENHPDRSLESLEPGIRNPGIGSEGRVSSRGEGPKRSAASLYAAPAVSGQWSSEAAAEIVQDAATVSRARTGVEVSVAIEAKTNGQTDEQMDVRPDGGAGHAVPDHAKSPGVASAGLPRDYKNFSLAEVSQGLSSSIAFDRAPFQTFQLRAESGWSGSIRNLPAAVSGNTSAHTGKAVLATGRPQPPAVSADSSSDLSGDPKVRALSAATVQGATKPDSEADPSEQDSEQDQGIGKPAIARLTAAFSANLDRSPLPAAGRDPALPSATGFHGPANSDGAGAFQESLVAPVNSASTGLPDGNAKVSTADPYQRLDQVVSIGHGASPVLHVSAGRVTVGVHDPVLGWVEIKTQSAAGQVSAALVTASMQSHTSLAAQLPSIAQYLTEHDVRVNHLGVEHQPAGSNVSMSFDSNASGGRSGEGNAAGRPEATTESPERLKPLTSMTVQPAWLESMEEGPLSYFSVRV